MSLIVLKSFLIEFFKIKLYELLSTLVSYRYILSMSKTDLFINI